MSRSTGSPRFTWAPLGTPQEVAAPCSAAWRAAPMSAAVTPPLTAEAAAAAAAQAATRAHTCFWTD